MDAAKSAVKNIIGRSGHHDTEVDEHVNPAVTNETIKPIRHEETTTALDKEVHQDHYHTTVQPLQHREVLPEQHSHQQMPLQEREIHHGDSERVKSSVDREAARFSDTSTTHQTTHTASQGATAAGEHVHHHVHETVQPVIHKETVQPEVVHKTIPIHETHYAQAEHHGMSTLPTKTLSEFQGLGGKLTGQTQRHEEYEGHPRPYNPGMQAERSAADTDPAGHDGLHGSHSGEHGFSGGETGGLTGTQGSRTSGGLTGSQTGGLTGTHGSHTSGDRMGDLSGTSGSGLTGTSGTTGGLSGTSGTHHVSGAGDSYSTDTGYTSGGVGSTGTALGGRTEGNTAGRALDAATHGSSGHTGTSGTSGIGSEDTSGRGLGHSTTDYSSTGGSHHDTHTDNSSSTNTANTGSAREISSDVQTPGQGKDPGLVEADTKLSEGGLKGQGVDGSHSAVFGLTPDGHKHDDTKHGTGSLKPAHSKNSSNTSSGDTGSRAPTGSGVAEQMNDPRVAEKGHDGSATYGTGSAKPGAGAPGGEQGFGQVRPSEHGSESKLQNKMDPNTDADNDGKRGVMD